MPILLLIKHPTRDTESKCQHPIEPEGYIASAKEMEHSRTCLHNSWLNRLEGFLEKKLCSIYCGEKSFRSESCHEYFITKESMISPRVSFHNSLAFLTSPAINYKSILKILRIMNFFLSPWVLFGRCLALNAVIFKS